ncbi:hypothetical protein ACFPMF_01650 [Larkinella bovis]|uniref:DUF4376 domain-containing protein n=1 Tax=Larkinella bovis TaxID=683041 RepID=A0ABW0I3A3_9BACT
MKICILIVNRVDCQLSAMPPADEFIRASAAGSPFLTDPRQFAMYTVSVSDEVYQDVFDHRGNAYILAPDLALKDVSQIVNPSPAYFQLKDQTLERVIVPEETRFNFKKLEKLGILEWKFSQAKKGRFESSATGQQRYYDGGDFLTDSLMFRQAQEDGLFRCAVSETAQLLPVMHSNQDIVDVSVDFNTWYQALYTKFYACQQAVMEAETIEAVDSVTW